MNNGKSEKQPKAGLLEDIKALQKRVDEFKQQRKEISKHVNFGELKKWINSQCWAPKAAENKTLTVPPAPHG